MEKDNSQQKNLLIKLVKAIDLLLLFRTEKRKYTYLTKEGLALIQKRLLKVRPLTRRDILVMRAIDILLQSIFERIFLTVSHGYRPSRSVETFIAHVERWGSVI